MGKHTYRKLREKEIANVKLQIEKKKAVQQRFQEGTFVHKSVTDQIAELHEKLRSLSGG